jgi:uncharacterized protein (TIGR01777 family)
MPELTFKSSYPIGQDDLFAWHARPGVLRRLSPPWYKTEVKSWQGIQNGSRAVFRIAKGPFSSEWVAVHEEYIHNQQFLDYQESGPFQYWRHMHRFDASGQSGSQLTDEVDFQLKGGNLGEKFGAKYARREIERAFAYRHRLTGQDLLLHRHYNPSGNALRIGVTGSSGFIGSELTAFLQSGGHKVVRIVRRRSTNTEDTYWNPETGEIDRAALEGLDAVIHLAGEPVFGWKWDSAKKARIRESRVKGTRLLASTIASLTKPPRVFLTASGLSVYGSHGEKSVSEVTDLRPGGLLSTIAKECETAANPAVERGIRTVFLRMGVVLSPRGGLLKRILPLFESGLGGSFSPDGQWISWISMDDLLGAIYHSMTSTTTGHVNVTSPIPVSASQFAGSLGTVMRRPALVRMPRAIVQKAFGDVADELFFESVRAHPEYLAAAGYQFLYPQLDGALMHVLGRSPKKRLQLSEISSRY